MVFKKDIKSLLSDSFKNRYRETFYDVKGRINRFRYNGNNYECPICNRTFSTFLPVGYCHPVLKEMKVVGGGYRENSICPGCFSGGRERVVYLYLMKTSNIFRERCKVLHVAPERNLRRLLCDNSKIELITGDLRRERYGTDVKLDLTDIQFKDNFFDYVIANHVLEHILDDTKAMSEIYRILKPGGTGILQVPISMVLTDTYEDSSVISPQEREKVFGQKDHVRIYGADYEYRLMSVGFSVTKYSFLMENGEYLTKRYGLLELENVFAVTK